MKALLRQYRPEEFRDLIALNALFRPGPLKSRMDREFRRPASTIPSRSNYDVPELWSPSSRRRTA